MTDDGKTRQELVAELAAARRRVAELEAGLPRPTEATPDERIALHLDDGETRFRQVFDNMADGLALYQAVDDGADFIFVDHNAAGRRLGGLAPGEELGRRLTAVFPGVGRFGLLEALRRVWRTGEPERLPLRAYEDERIVQWVENYIFRLPSGLVAALYSDTSVQRRAEEALRESEERYRLLFDQSLDAIAIQEGLPPVFTWVNPAFCDLAGYAAEEVYALKPEDIWSLVHPEDRERVRESLTRRLTGASDGVRYSFRILRKDGGVRWVDVTGRPMRHGGKPMNMSIYRDVTDRKKTEAALRESETRFRTLFENAPLPYQSLDENGVFLDVNARWLTTLGYEKDEVVGRWFGDFLGPGYAEHFDRNFPMFKQACVIDGVEFEMVNKSGQTIRVAFNGRVQKDAEGRFLRTHCIFTDITERRRAEEALRDREEHYRRVVEAIQETLTVVRPDGTFLFANARAARNFGLSPEDMIGKNVGNLVPADEAEALAAAYARVAAGTGALRREIKVSMPGGPKWFLNTLMPIRYGHGASVLSLSLDITGRKAIEETLTFLVERPWRDRGEDFFQALARYLAETLDMDFVCVDRLDGDGLTAHTLAVWHDGQFEDNVSYTLKDTPCGDVVGKVVCCFPEGVARRFPDDRILQDIRGESYVGVTLWDAFGTPVGLIAVIGRRPLTDPAMAESIMRLASMSAAGELERLLSEEALIKAKERAESASRTKSEFLANMSHEIRTPLNGVLGMLQLLMTTPVSDEQKEYALAAIRSASRLTRLLSDILDLSRIEAGKLAVLNDAVFSPAELMASVRELFATTAASKDLDLVVNLDPDAPARLFGDEARLRQVLFNLVGNAIKFTEHGRVEVAASLVSPPGASPSRILFSVSDTGVGIPEDRLGDIFEPFTQVDGSYVRRHQGAGLGLAIVRRLVGLMGGDISVESAVGIGTSVHAVIPLRPSAAASPRPVLPTAAAAETPPSDVKPRLLLVEDEAVNRLSMKQLLVKSGYDVTTAENGLEALRACRAERFDCVLMDIQMPVMDGLEATRRIRGDLDLAVNPAVPVIAMTAYAMSGDREKFLSAGLDGYIAKPIEIAELVHLVDKLLGRPTGTGPGGDGPAG